jgi:uncharacterized protein with HEPN domain
MPRDPKVYLEDILEAILRIRDYTKDYDLKRFKADAKTADAVIRNLEIIGEAVKKLPEDIKGRQTDVEWNKIAGLRDILIHEYFGGRSGYLMGRGHVKASRSGTSCKDPFKRLRSRMKSGGYRYFVTLQQIRAYRKSSLRQKFAWLESANRFSHKMLKGKARIGWEDLRKGKI